MRNILLLLISGLFLMISCASDSNEREPSPRQIPRNILVSYTVLDQGYNANENKHSIKILHSTASLNRKWAKISHTGAKAPDVDFSQSTLVFVYMGQRNTGGYYYEIKSFFINDDGDFVLEITESTPGSQEMVTMALTSPYIIIHLSGPNLEPMVNIKTAQRP